MERRQIVLVIYSCAVNVFSDLASESLSLNDLASVSMLSVLQSWRCH